MMEKSESTRKEPGIAFPSMKTGTTNVNEEKEVSLVSSWMQSQAIQKVPSMKIWLIQSLL